MPEGGRRMESGLERKEKAALEILDLLAEIVEKGQEWDPRKRQDMRNQIQQLLHGQIGIK
jgi:hypothetical protein